MIRKARNRSLRLPCSSGYRYLRFRWSDGYFLGLPVAGGVLFASLAAQESRTWSAQLL